VKALSEEAHRDLIAAVDFQLCITHRDVFALPIEQLTPAAFKRTVPIGQLAAFKHPHG